jgi:hypothetical protein
MKFSGYAMRALILMSLLLLAGCASPASRAIKNSPDFKTGYSDGCASASLEGANKRDTSVTRDEAAYRANPAYHSGWGEGFGACHAMAAPQSPGSGPFGLPRTP